MAALAGVAAIAMYSCARDEVRPALEEQPESRIATVHFTASQAAGKAAFGEAVDGIRPTLWTANDSEVKLSLNYGSTLAAGVTPSQDFGSASFSAEIDFTGLTPPYTYYVVSPASVAKALSPSREAWKVSIPCEQTPSATSPDEAGVILAAQSNPYMSQTGAADVDLYFNHLTAYGRMSLANFNPGEATVQKVELTATIPFVGDWYWKCAATDGEHELIDYGASSTLTINTSRTSDIWFACAPVDMSGQMMVVTVYTSESCFEQFVEFPANRKFEAGAAAVFSIDMTGAEEYNISGGASVTASMNSFSAVSGFVDGDENVSYEASQGDALNEPAVNSSEIRIYQNGGLLTITANNDKTITNVTIGSSMATTVQVSIDGGSFGSNNSITVGGTYSTGTISASTVVFKCTGTDKTHRLYLNSLSVTYAGSASGSTADPLLEHSNYGCYLGTDLEWEYNPGTDQVVRSYDIYGFETYTLINPSNVEELEITGYKKGYIKGDSCPVSVNWRRGSTTVLSQDYSLKIIKEDGPKVWLGDGSGKGVIIKK